MANFSGTVKLGNLSDFIAPSQACVVKLDGGKVQLQNTDDVGEAGSVALQPSKQANTQASKGFAQTRIEGESSAVKVTLQDCLACSGCVTSAETVLLEHQSIDELRVKLKEAGTTVIMSVSPQTRASLAEHFGLTPEQVLRRLTTFFRGLGVQHVFDTTASRNFSLIETAAEFVHRYRLTHPNAATSSAADEQATNVRATSGRAANGTSAAAAQPGSRQSAADSGGALPMLASACPGWVCYAEKTHGKVVLPFISTAKSPQAVMGTLVKRVVCQQLGLDPVRVYHCAAMPCYDKKLEASRADFNLPGSEVPEVDSVLTTTEVAELLQQEGAALAELPDTPLQPLLAGIAEDGRLAGYPGGAGGYLEHVFRTAAREMYGRELPAGPLPLRQVRNVDFKEVALEVDGKVVLRFAAVYGFRNIQTLMRKINSGRCEYHYAEMRPRQGQTQQELIAALDDAYHHSDIKLRLPKDDPASVCSDLLDYLFTGGGVWCVVAMIDRKDIAVKDALRQLPVVQQLYSEHISGGAYSPAAQQLLHTEYHRRDNKLASVAMVSDW